MLTPDMVKCSHSEDKQQNPAEEQVTSLPRRLPVIPVGVLLLYYLYYYTTWKRNAVLAIRNPGQ
jgi:hypothetical protein